MERLLIESPLGGRTKEIELASLFVSFTLEEKRLRIFEDARGEDVLLIRRSGAYVYCGSSGCNGSLNDRSGIQKQLVQGDCLKLGPYRMKYETDRRAPCPPVPRAGLREWVLALVCAVLVPVILLLVSLLS